MRWTPSRDRKPRVTVRVEHRLDKQNIVDILCARAMSLGWEVDDSYNPSQAWLEYQVRGALAEHGSGTWPYWREHDYDGQEAALTAWAECQAKRLGAL